MQLTRNDAERDLAVISHARVLPLDVVHAKGSGHGGTAVGLTPTLYVLFQEFLRHDPNDPLWAGRDHFVLSCGHASLALYVQLYLSGYGIELEDLRQTRQMGSLTPGHPERGHTRGVEVTTGPLGQGVANAVGMALATQRRAAQLDPNRSADDVFRSRVWCLASDGDLQEGISHEAASLAGTLAIDDLVMIWDDNRISIEGDTAITFGEDVVARHRAYGWQVVEIDDAEDLDAIRTGFARATELNGPVLVHLRTRIGHPMPTVGGTAGAHSGDPGGDEVTETKRLLGLDPNTTFDMPANLVEHARRVADRGRDEHARWDEARAEWAASHPNRAALAQVLDTRAVPTTVTEALKTLRAEPRDVATRLASAAVLDAVATGLPWLWGGSADLAPSNGVAIADAGSILPAGVTSADWPADPAGQLLHFGIREHAMAAIANGIAAVDGGLPFFATFFVFSDYMRPALRLAALMQLPVVAVFSHDSVGVGEDGPTHQPIEHLWSNRAIPGLAVVRPADWIETVEAWTTILTDPPTGPTALVLSRQTTPTLPRLDADADADAADSSGLPTARGGYVLAGHELPDAIAIATGTEVAIALAARGQLAAEGVDLRVVSMPCVEWFDQQPAEYREEVLPPQIRARVSVEAGTATGWHRFVGLDGATVGIEDFGASGDGAGLLASRGVTVSGVVDAVHETLTRVNGPGAGAGQHSRG